MSSAMVITSALRVKCLEIFIKHRPMYQNIVNNVHTAKNITLKHCEFLPSSTIYYSVLVVCKQVKVLPVQSIRAN